AMPTSPHAPAPSAAPARVSLRTRSKSPAPSLAATRGTSAEPTPKTMGISRYSRRPAAPYPAVASVPNGATRAVRMRNVRLVSSVLAALGTEIRRISKAYRRRGTSERKPGLVGEPGAQDRPQQDGGHRHVVGHHRPRRAGDP